MNSIESYLKGCHHLWIHGKSGVGKTQLAEFVVGKQVQDDPRTKLLVCDRNFGAPTVPSGIMPTFSSWELLVCDRNFGAPTSNGKANDWEGVPLDCIATSEENILAAVRWTVEELKSREEECRSIAIQNREGADKVYPDYAPIFLVIDELDQTQSPINRKYKTAEGDGELTYHLEYIARTGQKYKVKLLLVSQSLDVGATGIPQSLRAQFSICGLDSKAMSICH